MLPISPERGENLGHRRQTPSREDQQLAIDRIASAIGNANEPFTDVYVLSHGWHRNYYSAVSTYDRLLSRMTRLLFRGRIEKPFPEYRPLFICVYWKSEVGEDLWVDFAGRRHRDNYKSLAFERFAAAGAEFENFLDEAFVTFSEFCAPDAAYRDGGQGDGSILQAAIKNFGLKDEPTPGDPTLPLDDPARYALRSQALWACYHEALAKGVRGVQDTRPTAFAMPGVRVRIVAKFLLAVVPIMTLIGLILGDAPKRGWDSLKAFVGSSWPTPPDNLKLDPALMQLLLGAKWFALWMLMFAVCGLIFWISCRDSRENRRDGRPSGVGWVTLLAWLPVQLTFAAPVLLALLYQYAFFFIKTLQYPERTKGGPKANKQDPDSDVDPTEIAQRTLSEPLARFARIPSEFLLGSMSPDNVGRAIATAADSQLAFFFMQRRGVESGYRVGEIYWDLMNHPAAGPKLQNARFYLAGHSFGGLVVSNAARAYYQFQRAAKKKIHGENAKPDLLRPDFPVYSLAFIEGALASGWFKLEQAPIANITNRITCIYSGADSATGFYYPLANGGRMSMGSVGLCEVPASKSRRAPLPVLAAPAPAPMVKKRPGLMDVALEPCPPDCREKHVHKAATYAALAAPPELPVSETGPTVTNIDGSKMIYEGPVATGGGHTDIYKDDVTYLLWAALHG